MTKALGYRSSLSNQEISHQEYIDTVFAADAVACSRGVEGQESNEGGGHASATPVRKEGGRICDSLGLTGMHLRQH